MPQLLSCRVLQMEAIDEEGRPADVEVTGPPLHVVRCAPNKMMSISAGFCGEQTGCDETAAPDGMRRDGSALLCLTVRGGSAAPCFVIFVFCVL